MGIWGLTNSWKEILLLKLSGNISVDLSACLLWPEEYPGKFLCYHILNKNSNVNQSAISKHDKEPRCPFSITLQFLKYHRGGPMSGI